MGNWRPTGFIYLQRFPFHFLFFQRKRAFLQVASATSSKMAMSAAISFGCLFYCPWAQWEQRAEQTDRQTVGKQTNTGLGQILLYIYIYVYTYISHFRGPMETSLRMRQEKGKCNSLPKTFGLASRISIYNQPTWQSSEILGGELHQVVAHSWTCVAGAAGFLKLRRVRLKCKIHARDSDSKLNTMNWTRGAAKVYGIRVVLKSIEMRPSSHNIRFLLSINAFYLYIDFDQLIRLANLLQKRVFQSIFPFSPMPDLSENEVSSQFSLSACISVFMYGACIICTLSAASPDSRCLPKTKKTLSLRIQWKIRPPFGALKRDRHACQSAGCYLVFLGWAFGKPRLNILFLLCNFYSSFRAALLEELFAHCLQLCPVSKKDKTSGVSLSYEYMQLLAWVVVAIESCA